MRFYDNAYLTGCNYLIDGEEYAPQHSDKTPDFYVMHYVCTVDGDPYKCDVKIPMYIFEHTSFHTQNFMPGMLFWDGDARRCFCQQGSKRSLATQGQMDRDLSLFSLNKDLTNILLWRQWEEDEISRGYESDYVIADDESLQPLSPFLLN